MHNRKWRNKERQDAIREENENEGMGRSEYKIKIKEKKNSPSSEFEIYHEPKGSINQWATY
ncbi:hypothetical protein CHS0354_032395 [Potamilus streckersoni]|uniref:Uncharacterized protein n=1 Tax=Potamilus streckersoni TaxID=2493646 RepID=A0AAE0THE8_9BIVA|nr:hypothetical protein CHS0354_032395 [Potamilus streckersoni]